MTDHTMDLPGISTPQEMLEWLTNELHQRTQPLNQQIVELPQQLAAANQHLEQRVDNIQAHTVGQQEQRSRVKAVRPKAFSGNFDSDPAVWLFQFNQWAAVENLSDSDKIKHAPLLLDGKAAIWWRGVVVNQGILPFNEFSNQLVSTFKPVNSVKIARDKLAALKQLASVSKYNMDFTQLVLEIDNISEQQQCECL